LEENEVVAAGSALMARQKRDDTSVKIGTATYRKAKMIAAYRGVPIAEYLTSLLEKPVERDYQKLRQQIAGDDPEPGEN
jgi:hypothetical protein